MNNNKFYKEILRIKENINDKNYLKNLSVDIQTEYHNEFKILEKEYPNIYINNLIYSLLKGNKKEIIKLVDDLLDEYNRNLLNF